MPDETATATTRKAAKAKAAKAKESKEPPKLVEYVVLRLLDVKLTPDLRAIFPEVNEGTDQLAMRTALVQGVWVPVMEAAPENAEGPTTRVRRIPAAGQEKAIEIVTGKAEDALPGTWRAISWSAWKGVTKTEPPRQVMLDVRTVIEED